MDLIGSKHKGMAFCDKNLKGFVTTTLHLSRRFTKWLGQAKTKVFFWQYSFPYFPNMYTQKSARIQFTFLVFKLDLSTPDKITRNNNPLILTAYGKTSY